jgi:diguanylate cyclase (GGDEF)-like protein/PAS domain S-box-containing protein
MCQCDNTIISAHLPDRIMTKRLPAKLFGRVLDASLDAAVIVCGEGKVRYLNAAMQELTGYSGAELLNQPIDGLVPEGMGEKAREFLQRYIAGGEVSDVLGQVREFELRHRSGEIIPVELKAVDLGMADGVRYFGAFLVDLRARKAEQARTAALLAKLEQQAMTDPLTALPNRRAYDAELARILARARRHNAPTSVGIADIDLFKQVNDQYGHRVGDLVLCEVGKAIERAARGADFVARTGGEEFGMLFPNTSIEMARLVAERIRKAVAASRVTAPDGATIGVTISIGLAALAPDDAPEEALARADAALYQAKERGRNRVETQ